MAMGQFWCFLCCRGPAKNNGNFQFKLRRDEGFEFDACAREERRPFPVYSHDPLFDPVIKFGYYFHIGPSPVLLRMDLLEQSLETSQDDIQMKSEEIDDPKPIVGSDLTIIEEDGSMSDDQTVDTLAHAQAILDADDDVQYQWKSDNGVMYRVYQVNPEDQEGESVASDFQTSSAHAHIQPMVLTSNVAANHFYVVGNDVLTSQPPRLAPRAETRPSNSTRVRRDDRRRATHNEVERRRRDKINNWILKLSKIIPDCTALDNNKSVQSKGCILAKACEYILDLRTTSQRLAEMTKENERLASHVEYLQAVNEKLKVENTLIRQRSSGAASLPGSGERRPGAES